MRRVYKTSDTINCFLRWLGLPPLICAGLGFCFNSNQNALFLGILFLAIAIALGKSPTNSSFAKINHKTIILDEENQKMTFQTPQYTLIIPFKEIERIEYTKPQEILHNEHYRSIHSGFNSIYLEHFRVVKKNSEIIDNIPLLSTEIIDILNKHTSGSQTLLKVGNMVDKIFMKILGTIWVLLSITLFFIVNSL